MMTPVQLPTSQDIFDLTYDAMLGTDVHAAMATLRTSLRELRTQMPPDEWKSFGEQARAHPLHELLRESPFTRRAHAKPRGYAGDAVLMDLIYGIAPPGDTLSPLGAMLYAFEFDSPCFQSVRTRRAALAREIDAAAARRPHARVLSVACGHLREIEWSRAARMKDVSITAIDQDSASLAVVERSYGRYDVAAREVTVGDLLRRSVPFADLDLVYAAGLYDYLEDDLARVLTAVLFRTLRSGGRLFVANFTPATHDAAFMEAIMDWHLVYRTPEAIRALTRSIPAGDIDAIDQFCDDHGQIAYLRARKR